MATAAEALSTIFGERECGQEVRVQNVSAVQTVANILKSSLGPQGLDKMLVDDIGELLVTNDGATILKQLEIKHAAARILVDLSDLQDHEVGDGTTSVVILAAELLKRGNQLILQGVHPATVIAGYKLANREAINYLTNHLTVSTSLEDTQLLSQVAKTSLSSKLIGAEADFFADIVLQAVTKVKTIDDLGSVRYPVSAVNVLKTHGKSTGDSFCVDGFCLSHTGRAAQGMPVRVENAKIALLDFGLKQHRMHLGVNILVEDPAELGKIRLQEKDICKDRCKKILAAGANVILTSQGIDDMAMKYFVEAGAIAVRRVPKKDLKRIAKATGGQIMLTMSTIQSDEEEFNASNLGTCAEVAEERVGDWDYLFLRGCPKNRATSIVLRGANDYMLDEVERCVHDALCAVSKTLESSQLCAGGGAAETALAVYLGDFAETLGSREQIAVAEFAEALLVIPKTLAANAALDSIDLMAKLRAAHHASQTNYDEAAKKAEFKWYGLDLTGGKIRNNLKAGVVEPALIKTKGLKFATEAATTILRIDDLIRLRPEPQRPDDME